MTTKETFVAQMTAMASAKAELEKAWHFSDAEGSDVIADSLSKAIKLTEEAMAASIECGRVWES